MLKNCVTLAYPNPANPLSLSCDASATSVGAVLEEFQEGQFKPIGFWSKHLPKAKQNWSCFRRELLAIQAAIRHFLPDIIGRNLTIWTDHKSILGAFTAQNLQTNDPVATRQLLEISQYSYDVRYKPGKINLTADQLSRPNNVPVGDAYKPSLDSLDTIAAVKETMTDIKPLDIFKAQSTCPEVKDILLGRHSPRNRFKFIVFKGQKLLCETSTKIRPFLPEKLRQEILQNLHSLDHAGQKEMVYRTSKNYFWPKLSKDVSKFVKTCHPCQTVKPAKTINPKAKIFKVPDTRFSHLHTDVVGPLPVSEGMSYILTILCRKTKWVECIPLPAATSLNCCNGFIRGWLQRYGCPQEIICDNGLTYQAGLWRDLQRVLGVEVTFVPPYHQSTNGAIERQHRTIKESIKAALVEMGNTYKDKWMLQLPLTMLGRRVALQPDMGASPAQLALGGDPVIPGVLVPDTPENNDTHQLLKTVQANVDKPAVPMSRHCPEKTTYTPKDLNSASHVYVKIENPDNLGQKYVGPHEIIDRPTNTTLVIRVGYDKNGLPRLQTVHWNNCRIAYLRPDAETLERPGPGRPKSGFDENYVNSNMAAEIQTTPQTAKSATEMKTNHATSNTDFQRYQLERPAAPAANGREINPSSHYNALNEADIHVTGPPPVRFQQQKQTLRLPGTLTPDPKPVTREPLPREASGGLAPPVTKGAPQSSPRSSSTSNPTPASSAQAGQSVLHDHDYFRQPTATSDHDYFVRPPPGFDSNSTSSHGRPQRSRNLPTRFHDYELN